MKNIALLFLLVNFIQACPELWSVYKTVSEGPFITNNVTFRVKRSTKFRCNDNEIEFQSNRILVAPPYRELMRPDSRNPNRSSLQNFTYDINSGFGDCQVYCNNFDVKVFVQYAAIPYINEMHFYYVNKNCDKLYWSNWAPFMFCMSSSQTIYKRLCIDCDGDVFPYPKYCYGNTTRIKPCQPTWSEWEETGPCNVPNCNLKGVRVKTRKCLYGDGSQANDSRLCSTQSNIMTELCKVNKASCVVPPFNNNVNLVIAIVGSAIIGCLVVLLFVHFYLKNCTSAARQHNQSNVATRINNRSRLPTPHLSPTNTLQSYAVCSDSTDTLQNTRTNPAFIADNQASYQFAESLSMPPYIGVNT